MPQDGAWRCRECGHGRHLEAIAGANAWGPLDLNGKELARHDDVIEWGIHVETIECKRHLNGELEHKLDGRWCRWKPCSRCEGKGRIHVYRAYQPNAEDTCPDCAGSGGSWVRPEVLAAA